MAAGYGRRRVFEQMSLEFPRGSFTAVVGPNGCGKSTLLQVLAGLFPPAAGEVWLHGRSLMSWSARERAHRLAWLPQTPPPSELTARETVALGRFAHTGWLNQHQRDDAIAVQRALESTGSVAVGDRRVTTLSGGERQRVSLARTLAVGADVLLLDEPTSHLDPPHQIEVVRILRAQAQAGAAIVAVIHDLSIALMADRIAVLSEQGLVGSGTIGEALAGNWLSRGFGTPITVLEIAGVRLWKPQVEASAS